MGGTIGAKLFLPRLTTTGTKADQLQTKAVTRKVTPVINLLISARVMRTRRKALLIVEVAIFAVRQHMLLVIVQP